MAEKSLAKIAITPEADGALIQALETINKDNPGGRVSKIDLASWLLLKSAAHLDAQTVEEVRLAHFKQVTYLETLLRELKQSGRESLSLEEISRLQTITKKKNIKNKSETTKNDQTQPSKTKE